MAFETPQGIIIPDTSDPANLASALATIGNSIDEVLSRNFRNEDWVVPALQPGFTSVDNFGVAIVNGFVVFQGGIVSSEAFPTNADTLVFTLPDESWRPRGYVRLPLAGYGSTSPNMTFLAISTSSNNVFVRGVGASSSNAWVGGAMYPARPAPTD